MHLPLIYTPIFRLRAEEKKLLQSFDFGNQIYPLIEIIKEQERIAPKTRKGKSIPPANPKQFNEIYIPILNKINSKKIFVDLPVHMNDDKKVKPEVLSFLRKIVGRRELRTSYLNSLSSISDKLIPVISTYSQRTGEINSILLQEKDLRTNYNNLAFRTSPKTFKNDIKQIDEIAQKQDYLIVDLEDLLPDPQDEEIIDVIERLKKFDKCHIIVVRSAINSNITNVGLDHGKIVKQADNSLLKVFKKLEANSFGDYAGIKKDGVHKGGGRSPGFIYYNPLDNNFLGFKGSVDASGKSNQNLADFEDIIVPDVIKCSATAKMKSSPLEFLNTSNEGWQIIQRISKGAELGKSAAKFKRIAMEHYVHCIKIMIDGGKLS